jgi:hypothetical protein
MKAITAALMVLGTASAADWAWLFNTPPISMREPGFTEGGNKRNISITMFYDLLCSGSAFEDPIFQSFLNSQYEDKALGVTAPYLDFLEVTYSFVPLPYHHASWIPAVMA